MSVDFKYASPIHVNKLNECYFYHRMDIPGVGEVGEGWDLRNVTDKYLGNFDFSGKRALDVGAASGYLTFEMEKRGADVVSFDMENGAQWDIVPHFQIADRYEKILSNRKKSDQKLKNGYWLTHEKLQSNGNNRIAE